MYSQQSYGVLHPVNPTPSAYPAGSSWGQQLQPQMNASPAGPMNDPTLPPGWLKQWNPQYQTWFFVNTYAQPPLSQWIHPAHSLPPGGAPPMMGTDPTRAQNASYHPGNNLHGQVPSAGSYQPSAPQFAGQAPAMQRQAAIIPPINQTPAPNKGGSKGAGLLAAGVGAMGGLALGGLLSHEWKEHQHREHRRENEAYTSGLEHGEREREDEAYAAGLEQGEHQRDDERNYNRTSNENSFDETYDNSASQEVNEDQSYEEGDW